VGEEEKNKKRKEGKIGKSIKENRKLYRAKGLLLTKKFSVV